MVTFEPARPERPTIAALCLDDQRIRVVEDGSEGGTRAIHSSPAGTGRPDPGPNKKDSPMAPPSRWEGQSPGPTNRPDKKDSPMAPLPVSRETDCHHHLVVQHSTMTGRGSVKT
jgi:hypothetical protein